MRALQVIFQSLSTIIELYSMICIARIIITWIPSVTYSKPGQILARICDPYLNLFRRFRWLQIGSIDFSPVVALCLLEAMGSVFGRLARTASFSVGFILALIINIIWTVCATIISFFFILLLVRLIFLIIEKNRHTRPNFIMESIDRSIMPVLYKLISPFCRKRKPSYIASVIVGMIACMILSTIGTYAISIVSTLLSGLKF